jgi:hypothetical protein
LKSVEKIKTFKKNIADFEKRKQTYANRKSNQRKLDRDQHYDIDGVTQEDSNIIIPPYDK